MPNMNVIRPMVHLQVLAILSCVAILVEGAASVASQSLQTVEAGLSTGNPASREFTLHRIFQRAEPLHIGGGTDGPHLTWVGLGQEVLVTLHVTSGVDLFNVTVVDPLPGALTRLDSLQPPDAGLRPTAGAPRREGPRAVRVQFPHIKAGEGLTHKYRAVAASLGTFDLQPAKAFLQHKPEIMVTTPGGKFSVVQIGGRWPKRAPGRRQLAALSIVKCPEDCNYAGKCNATSGECICDLDFYGPDCSEHDSTRSLPPTPPTLRQFDRDRAFLHAALPIIFGVSIGLALLRVLCKMCLGLAGNANLSRPHDV